MWPLLGAIVGAMGVVMSMWISLNMDTQSFVPGACGRLDGFLSSRVVGQEMAITQLVDAVCTHLAQPHPPKPLIISVHGPPGVGKTYTHTLLARALYNSEPGQAVHCPGEDCQGAKVIYGMDFMLDAREQQLAAVREAILHHARTVRDPLIVIEEYDKLDCASRGMLRQMMGSPEVSNVSLNRAIILLESNLGFTELEELVLGVGRSQVTAEQAEKALRSRVFSSWQRSGCEEFSDTLKLLSLVDFFLPFFPLQREQVEELVLRSLQHWGRQLWQDKQLQLEWGAEVVTFLTDRVDFDGPFPLEGGKQVTNVATRYLSRLVRTAPPAPKHPKPLPKDKALGPSGGGGAAAPGRGAAAAGGGGGAAGQGKGAWLHGVGDEGAAVMRLVVQGNSLGVHWPQGQ